MRKIASLLTMLLLLIVLIPIAALAQTSVTGKVTDAQNAPLAGATISVRGSNISTQTDQNGNFTISVPNSNARLVVSFVGYTSRTLDASSNMSIQLEEDRANLSEVVVTGLATSVKRSNLANSVATISAKELTGSTRQQTVDAALQGKVAGAQILATSGAPGGGFSVRLRGISSINLSSEPLYIIDGVYMNNSQFQSGGGTGPFSGATTTGTSSTQDQTPNRLADLNPADIENIEILKGPSAAAIYGTRANAGVIIITTKRGRAGKTNISFGQDVGISSAINLLGLHESKWDQQFKVGTDKANAATYTNLKAARNPGDETWNYEDIIYGNTGFIRNTRLGVTGGTDKIRFYAGGNLWDESGVQKRTGYARNSARINLDLKPTKWWDVSVATNYTNTNSDRGFSGNNNNGVAVGYSIAYLPNWLPQLPVNGVYPTNPLTGQNIFEIIDKTENNEKVNRYIVSFNNTFHLLRRDNHSLKFQAQGGLDYIHQENFLFMPEELQFQQARANPGAVRYSTIRNRNINMQGFLVDNFEIKQFGFTTSAGMVRLEAENRSNWFQGEGLPRGTTNPNNATVQLSDLNLSSWQDVGYVVQEEVNWGDKIIGTAGIRWDKSSLNGPDANKLYAFPKASLAVNLSNFDFWNVPVVNYFKLRSAYGQTGNPAGFGTKFTNISALAIDGFTGFSFPTIVGNPGIQPEISQELEFGVDFGLFNNRISGEVTYYNRVIKDFIDTYNLSPGTGVTSIRAFNVGDIENKGVEVTLGSKVIQKRNITWSTNINWWQNRSEITRLDIPEKATANTGFGVYGTQRLRLGNSPSQWYGTPNVNGLPTAYEDAQPKWQASWSNNFTFLRNFEFSFLVHRSHKNFNSNLGYELTDGGGTTKDWSELNKDGIPIGKTRTNSFTGSTSRKFIQDASFTKLREASLYYTLPKSVYGNVGAFKNLEQVRVGISGNNIFVWSDYYGYDPEVANFGNRPTIASVDVMTYPAVRRLYFHLNVNF
jgi:TonB-linked SusC/RagA family outer membrane protein